MRACFGLAATNASSRAAASASDGGRTPGGRRNGNHDLVIVESPAKARTLSGILGSGYEITTDGLKLARSRDFHLILMDIVLPQMDGITVCRMLKSDPRTASIPLYMLTAKTKKSDVENAAMAGADGYIQKPFRGADLMALVDRLRTKAG